MSGSFLEATRPSPGRLVSVLAQNKALPQVGEERWLHYPPKKISSRPPWPSTPRVASLFKDSIYEQGSANFPS